MPLFRFPGGKTKIKSQVLSRIAALREGEEEYGELFLGAGAILECLLTDSRFAFSLVRLNDRDAGIAAVWSAIIRYPEQLKEKLLAYTPSVADFDRFKVELLGDRGYVGSGRKMVDLAAKKIILHQISFSGLGVMAGGPIGGRTQGSKYSVSCRYNPEGLCRKIDRLRDWVSRVQIVGNACSCQDFAPFLRNANGNQIWYIDPPFYQRGPQLYQFGFSDQEHVNLANTLKASGTKFVLSYDDHPTIREMYQWACIERIEGINYSIHTARQRAELLISSWTSKRAVQVGTRHLRRSCDLLTAEPSKSVALVSSFTSEKGEFKMSTKTNGSNGKLPPEDSDRLSKIVANGTEPDLSKRSPLLVELEKGRQIS
jgi:DNA adenine methylase